MHPRATIKVGNTPEVLTNLGANQLPMEISQNVVDKVVNPDGVSQGKHGLGLEMLKKLPEQLNDPVMVYKSATAKNSFVILTALTDSNGKSVVAAIHMDVEHGRNLVNAIASMYGRNNEISFVKNQFQNDRVLYMNEKKSHDWFQSRGLQLPSEWKYQNHDSVTSIIQQGEKDVNKYKIGKNIANPITLDQIQQKFPTLKFSEIPDGYQAIVPNGHAIEIKLNQDITHDYDAVLQAYGKEVADAVERGEMGAKGVTQAAVIMTKEGKISFGAVVELAKTANLGILDHETIHVVEALDLISEKAWKALERKYDPNGKLNRAELEESVAEAYRAWNGQSSHMVFSRIKKFFKDLYDLVASPETIKLYKSISNGSIFVQQSNTEQSGASFSGELASSKYKYSIEDIKKKLGFKTSDNVTIVEKPKSGINPLRYFTQSASRLAEINPKIKPFVREALKAEEANETMRNDFSHRMDKAMTLLKDNKDLNSWTDLMWLGDALKEEFTNSELQQDGHNNNVIKAYRMARIAIDKAYKLANEVHQGIETHTKNFNRTELQDFHNNPFITEVISEKPSGDNAHTLVTYRSPQISEIKDETVTAQQLEDLRNDENIQVLGKPSKIVGHILPGAKSIVHGDEMYLVNYRQQKAPINKLSGYVSHIFHEWTVYRKDVQPDGSIQYVSESSADSIINARFIKTAYRK